jgi:hypothetical protein
MEENDSVTCCGLCCLDCHGYKGKIADLARDLRRELRSARYDVFASSLAKYPFAAAFQQYPECYEVLGLMMKFRCKKGCRDGGGPPGCAIRTCCSDKEIAGCWECSDFDTCTKLDFLNEVHGDAHRKNLRIIAEKGVPAFLRGKRYY